MKQLNKTILSVLLVITIIGLYLLQSCGGVHYDSYVTDYKDVAIEEMIRTGYPASIKLAQAILESEGGRSELAIDHNNHFAILCNRKWKGPKHRVIEEDYATGEKLESCYKVYDTAVESFIAHTNLLKKSSHYKSLFKLKDSNYILWAERLMELGYSNSDTYDMTLISMIEQYDLATYDDIALGNDLEYADESGYDEEQEMPSTFDRQAGRFLDRFRSKKEQARIKTEDQIADLKEKITNTQYDFSEDDPSWEREIDEQVDGRYSDQAYSNRDYEDNRRSSDPRAIMDSKYKDLHKTRLPRAKRRAYGSNNNERNSSFQETTAAIQEENLVNLSSEETSIADFADDYTYINGSIIVYARYDDTPLTIANRYGVSVNDIIAFNESITKNQQILREGLFVFLEAKKKNYLDGKKYHAVQYAETMEDIAATYGLLLKELYAKNRMPMGSQPAVGQRIKLNKGKIKQRPELRSNHQNEYQTTDPVTPPPSVAINNYKNKRIEQPTSYNQDQAVSTKLLQKVTTAQKYHTVKAGESLYGIARLYELSPKELMHMNGLRSERINRGMRLIIRD